jgi:LPS sulfotransferase NodH
VPVEPTIDLDYIRKMEEHIDRQHAAWERHFALRDVEPLTIEYEVLDGDYRGQVARVLSHLGLDESVAETLPEPRLARQSALPGAERPIPDARSAAG